MWYRYRCFCLCLCLCFRFKVKLLSLYLTAISNQNLKQTSVSIVISGLKEQASQGTKLIGWPRQRFRAKIQLQKEIDSLKPCKGSCCVWRASHCWGHHKVAWRQELDLDCRFLAIKIIRGGCKCKKLSTIYSGCKISAKCTHCWIFHPYQPWLQKYTEKKTFRQMSPHYQPWLRRNTKKKYSLLDFPSLSTRVAQIRQYEKDHFWIFH